MLERAETIARAAHRGQSDKRGHLFVWHVLRVAEAVSGTDAKTVALLHDVVEKGPGWTLERLRAEGFPQGIVDAVDALSRRDGEDEEAFVRRAASVPLAVPVKRADLADNLESAHLQGDSQEIARYEAASRLLAELTR